ncbi:MAG: hypothetical protein CM1200mP29_09600 [Verrucomicrobiota bacterium]|nr:MAG: hypothetical protein CM1200mP29_09600 [Verrucomicrobiota bacterium]
MFFVKTTKPVSGSGRHSLDVLRKAGLQIVCLDAETGGRLWARTVDNGLEQSRNILFLAASGDYLIATGSRFGAGNDTEYRVHCFSVNRVVSFGRRAI